MSEEKSSPSLKTVVLGAESHENLRLANTLRKIYGQDAVHRYLETRHLLEDVEELVNHPVVACVDLFGLDLKIATDAIAYLRTNFPSIVFIIYLEPIDWQTRFKEIPGEWSTRLQHYYRLFKVEEDVEFEPIVRSSLRFAQTEAELLFTYYQDNPSQLPPHVQRHKMKDSQKIFISYSRVDWDKFVKPLVDDLKTAQYDVWIDQHLLVGGEDWMDAIGEALDSCKILVLIVSPESVDSRYVKMEYRYFFNHGKTIIPVLYRPIKRFPPELTTTQYVDCTATGIESGLKQLKDLLQYHLP